MLKVAVPFRCSDGQRVVVEAEGGVAVAVAKRRAALLAGADPRSELRVVRGRELLDESTTLAQLRLGPSEALVLVEVREPTSRPAFVALLTAEQCVPEQAAGAEPVRAEAATAEDIARATGGQAPTAAAAVRAPAMPAPAAQEVQNRIRGFMESLFARDEEGSSSGEEREEEREGEGEEEEHQQHQQQQQQEAAPEAEEAAVAQLTAMGFSAHAARKALLHCGGAAERAMDWILEHAADPALDEPLSPAELAALRAPGRRPPARRPLRRAAAPAEPDPAIAARLTDMGFPPEQVADALRATRNDEEAAVSVLLGEGGPREGGPEAPEAPEAPGMGLLDNPVLRALLMHPGIQEGLRNPRVLEAFRAIMMDPAAARDLLADPEVGPVLLQVNRVLREGGAGDGGEEEEAEE